MFVLDHTLEIDAPAATVWTVLTDFAAYGQWNPFVSECRCDLRPGGALDMRVHLGKRPQTQREWIADLQPGRGFSYRMKPIPLGALRSFRSHRIEVIDERRSRYHSHFEIDGWLQPLILALFRGGLERGFAGMSEALKQRAESLCRR